MYRNYKKINIIIIIIIIINNNNNLKKINMNNIYT